MRRGELEHVLRASAAITGHDRFVIVGSQAIHGTIAEPPPALISSIEVDLFTERSPEDAELIDGSIGEGSPFHETFGYYAHGIPAETATLPGGWRNRLVELRGPGTRGAVGLCLDAHDLAISKAVAGRPKDETFLTQLRRIGVLDSSILMERLAATELDPRLRVDVEARLRRLLSEADH